ncbi:MAG TPA: DUF1844 domain-containing protein [Terriglobia bacterium]|nr:DUF1844 domain-containing protein [Terriglobia bacterium]
MAEETREESGFKVVDRRTFTAEGTRREGAPVVDEKRSQEAEKPRSAPEPTRDAREDRLDEGFAMLVEFLANSALLHLGLGAGPTGEPIPVDLQSARTMIDLLDVIQDKTKGNLTPSERKLLDDILFELHTRFVELQKQATAKRR